MSECSRRFRARARRGDAGPRRDDRHGPRARDGRAIDTRARLLLRGLGLVYLSAFGSLAVQVDGLIGSRGILPAAEFFDQARRALGPSLTRFWLLPTLLWLDASDRMLHVLCWGGVVLAAALSSGCCRALLVLLWLFYLSLMMAGQVFLGYQWDRCCWRPGSWRFSWLPGASGCTRPATSPGGSPSGCVRWLVFRLMFLSGVVKLASGDPSW